MFHSFTLYTTLKKWSLAARPFSFSMHPLTVSVKNTFELPTSSLPPNCSSAASLGYPTYAMSGSIHTAQGQKCSYTPIIPISLSIRCRNAAWVATYASAFPVDSSPGGDTSDP